MSAILINGTSYGWSNIQVVMLGSAIEGITKIDYKRSLNAEALYGAGQEPVSYGYGQYKYTASIEIYTEEWKKISQAAGGNPLAIPPFNITVLFLPSSIPDGNGVVFPFKDIIYNCQFLEDGLSTTSGDTNIKVSIPLLISGFDRFA